MMNQNAKKLRPLGHTQEAVLEILKKHGSWSPSSPWVWSYPSKTKTILDSLVRYGLVVKTRDTYTPVKVKS